MRHGTAKEERGGGRTKCGTAPRKKREGGTHEVRHGTAKEGRGRPHACGTALRKGEHNPTRNRKFANANNVSRRFMLPFY